MKRAGSMLGKVDSQFEADVAAALRERELRVLHQYPACGFKIDLVVQREAAGVRVAVECDGERYHLDEHGLLRIEDIERQSILERAGWRVVRIPYRKWLADPRREIDRVVYALDELSSAEEERGGSRRDGGDNSIGSEGTVVIAEGQGPSFVVAGSKDKKRGWLSREQTALLEALKEGRSEEDDVLRRVRDMLGSQRLTQKLRQRLNRALFDLASRNLIAVEDGEYFLLPEGRKVILELSSAAGAHQRRIYHT